MNLNPLYSAIAQEKKEKKRSHMVLQKIRTRAESCFRSGYIKIGMAGQFLSVNFNLLRSDHFVIFNTNFISKMLSANVIGISCILLKVYQNR